jgi:hypothetical protein
MIIVLPLLTNLLMLLVAKKFTLFNFIFMSINLYLCHSSVIQTPRDTIFIFFKKLRVLQLHLFEYSARTSMKQ